jgi:hypothetical protein
MVSGADPDAVGRLALAAGIPLRALGARSGGLEDDFLALVSETEEAP